MAGDIDKINELFKAHDEKNIDKNDESVNNRRKWAAEKVKNVDRLLIDESGHEASNYTGDDESERDYRPIRQSHESHTGCMGGLLYFVFVACISVVLACLAWMSASDMLALNKDSFTATVNLPVEIFSSKTIDTFDEEGNKTGTKRVTSADISYVAEELKDAGFIEYKWLFEFFCKISNADQKVSPGEYKLNSSYDYRALIQHMRSGSSAALTVDVTIPEGFTMEQIFRRLEENQVCSYEDLMDAAANYKFNYSFLEGLPEGEATRLEGFLFPDTYQFYVGMQASSAINKFLSVFHTRYTSDMLNQSNNLGMSVKDVVTIASLIEKEAASDNERGLISSVIHNRLKAGMPLGIDASILYLHQEHEGAPTAEMLAEETPYNTRIYAGLTPTPISSPGLASVNAALYPDSSNYYYYALDTATGEHRFFATANEHANFVATQNYE